MLLQRLRGWASGDGFAIVLAGSLAFGLFLTTLQLDINGSPDPYATDVGEIQNALPRWGTIHFSGYPQYTLLGSIFVTALRAVGMSPAPAASALSAVWGSVSIGMLTALILGLRVRRPVALGASLLFALSTSMWIDASVAEVHAMTMALTFASLLVALRVGRHGRRRDWYWLAFLVGQGVTHQRAFAFVIPPLCVLIWRQRRAIRFHLPGAVALALTGPLTYLYLSLADWMGSEWVFSAPGTWRGFSALVLDIHGHGEILSVPVTAEGWRDQLSIVIQLLNNDWPWPFWVAGLIGLTWPYLWIAPHKRLALALIWVPYILVSLIIWEGTVSDALLAVKMPVIAAAAIGLGLLTEQLWRWRRWAGVISFAAGCVIAAFLYVSGRPEVLAITRHAGAAETISLAAQITPADDGQPTTLMALWGNDYWQLAYAQAFEGELSHLNLVDHNANLAAIVARGDHLVTLSRTFYRRPIEWWEGRLGEIHLSEPASGIVEISPMAATAPQRDDSFELGNGILIRSVQLERTAADRLALTIEWQARESIEQDFSVAIHLVSQEPPSAPEHVLAQADSAHPVDGWYPTSLWNTGEVVIDRYSLKVPPDAEPVSVRVAMYRVGADGQFINTAWLVLHLP